MLMLAVMLLFIRSRIRLYFALRFNQGKIGKVRNIFC